MLRVYNFESLPEGKKNVCLPQQVVLPGLWVFEVGLVDAAQSTRLNISYCLVVMVERYLVMVDKRNSEILVRSEVGVSLRDGHSYGVPGIGSCAGEVGEEPPIDVMDLRGPHVVLTPHRPTTGREDVALELPVHQVRGEVDGEG